MINNKIEKKGGLVIYQLDEDTYSNNSSSNNCNVNKSNDNDNKFISYKYYNLNNNQIINNNYNNNNSYSNNSNANKNKIYTTDNNMIEEAFNEMTTERPSDQAADRLLIVLDGANVGWGYGRNRFDVNGIISASNYFKNKLRYDKRQLNIVTFIPAKYLHNHNSKDYNTLLNLVQAGVISLVPSGDHDDAYVITYARENHGFMITNDFYKDHISKIDNITTRQATEYWIKENRCSYTFVNNVFMLNPGSLLYDCIHYNSNNDKDLAIQSHEINNEIFLYLNKQFIKSDEMKSSCPHIYFITLSINECAHRKLVNEIKYLLMSRAHALIEIGLLHDAKHDLDIIINFFDNNCYDAKQLLHKLRSHMK